MVGGPACEWVLKDGLAVGGLAVAVGGCVGCVGWRQLCFDFGGFFLCVCVCVWLWLQQFF